MWLLPALSGLASFSLRAFYRLSADGGRVESRGPLLLVANHPNSLVDPAAVAAAAGRPVRFLAKAPLFTDPMVGWLVRGAGAIPVHRTADDPARMGENVDAFRAAYAALAAGDAVGIFPEGLSHSEPSLTPLRTGAARLALGGAALLGGPFPVVPVGLVFRDKERFRSRAITLVGEPISWMELAERGPDDRDAVVELTRRIDDGLRAVTVNLERWEDAPLVECAEAVYAAEVQGRSGPAARVERIREVTERLARLRGEGGEGWAALAHDLSRHRRILRALRLRPADLHAEPEVRAAVGWSLRQAGFFLLGAPLAVLGGVLFLIPYRLTGLLEARARPLPDVRATWKLFVGGVLHLVWIVLLSGIVAIQGGWLAAMAVLIALPLLGVTTLAVLARWSDAAGEARRFWTLRRSGRGVQTLRERQRAIGERLEALRGAETAV